MRAWTFVFATLTALLCVAVAFVVRENQRLHGQISRLVRAGARAAGLDVGDVLAPFTLRDGTGHEVAFDFAGDELGTVLLFHASSCDACTASRIHWRQALERAARPDVRVLCIQTDVVDSAPLALEGLPASLAVPLPPEGWLAALPAVPATLVVDEHGRVTHAWYRALDAGMADELAAAVASLGSGG
ncbi:MAG TPA: hypothetical protein VF530_23970 [Planctomycetota bacterium]